MYKDNPGGWFLHEQLRRDFALGPEPVLNNIIERFECLLQAEHLTELPIRDVVVGLPRQVDFGRGLCVRPPITRGWDGFEVSKYLRAKFHAPVLVDNDVNLMALGEARSRPSAQSPLLFAKVSTGIGCGIITADGQLHRGADVYFEIPARAPKLPLRSPARK